MKKILCALWLLVPLTAVSAAEQGWSYDASFYAWLAGIDGTIGVGRAGDEPIEATFSDLAGFVDFAAAGHFEARSARTVLLADINYVGLADERDAEIAGQTVTVDMDYDQWIIEFAGGYRATGAVDLLIAGRYYMQDTERPRRQSPAGRRAGPLTNGATSSSAPAIRGSSTRSGSSPSAVTSAREGRISRGSETSPSAISSPL